MQLNTIPRAYVTVALHTARLPLAAAGRLTHHSGDDTWPPALAFDTFEANVKQVVGSLISDDELVHEGRIDQARVAELREAGRLETVAEQTKGEARQTFQARREADARKRREATERAKEREAEVERQARESRADADRKARERQQQAREVEQDRKEALAKKQRADKAKSVAKERSAVATAKRASDSKAKVLAADKKIRATKAARRSE